ncbi:hypothetical protein GMI69_06665 [Eggerthellaceae bacterium zg-887]|uniref:hypothetical protein n=1 Tax=Xiamenia xianingshaonis TaxID=2682776 RepID=UPI00140C5C7E|nr:hypothetical protein [Xiamenia xianingshaonis]NHM16340.1 hypothetical protein [Xiamenia xianingshaonis]
MPPADTLERVENIKRHALHGPRITVTELSRSTDWRSQLPSAGIIEVTDRGDTAAWLLSDQDLRALVDGYVQLEEELEQAQIAELFESREDASPLSGGALKDAARAVLRTRKDQLAALVDGR